MLYLELSSVKNLCSEKVRKFLSIYGYSRVSTSNQDYKTQIQKLERAGAEKIFSEKYTGTKKEGRKELEELLSIVKTGDKVLVTKIDRLARSIVDLNSIISSLNNSGVTITFLDNALTFEPNKSDSMQTLMMNMLGSFAQFERDLIVTRTQEGKQWHRANNKNYREGRPKRVLNDKYKHALELIVAYPNKQYAGSRKENRNFFIYTQTNQETSKGRTVT